jgi:Phytanoyl-CoA dioxygenase (PhyH)
MTDRIDARALRAALFNDGYTVFRHAVTTQQCQAVLDAIAQDLGIRVDDPDSWDRVSGELDQVPLWGHQSQWDIRQDPSVHRIWSAVWGTERLWAARDSCRFTPPWRPGRAEPLSLHWDVDPRDPEIYWYQGIVALTDTAAGEGGFCCAPTLMRNQDRWPTTWPVTPWGTEYRAGPVADDELVEVPLQVGDMLIVDSHLPHGTVRNLSSRPRVAFYLQLFPAGTAEEAEANIADHEAGIAPPWWRWKPGHDRVEPGPPARLTALGRRLIGLEPWSPSGRPSGG